MQMLQYLQSMQLHRSAKLPPRMQLRQLAMQLMITNNHQPSLRQLLRLPAIHQFRQSTHRLQSMQLRLTQQPHAA